MVNIFYLDDDPKESAKYYHDKQVNIMPCEIAQILYRIHNHCDSKVDYPFNNIKAIKLGLNICKWILESSNNYMYCAKIGLALVEEHKDHILATVMAEHHLEENEYFNQSNSKEQAQLKTAFADHYFILKHPKAIWPYLKYKISQKEKAELFKIIHGFGDEESLQLAFIRNYIFNNEKPENVESVLKKSRSI